YCGMQCYLWFLWMRKPPVMGLGSQDPWPPVTVIVPVRNEEDHLRNCLTALLSQEYPGSTMQVIVVDDHSTDRTLDIARDFVNVEVISLPTGKSGKKMAIQAGIQAAQADVLVTVDGDCVMGAQ